MPRDRWALKNTMATKAWLQHFKGQIIQTGLVQIDGGSIQGSTI